MNKKSKKAALPPSIDKDRQTGNYISPICDAARIISTFNQSAELDQLALANKIYDRFEQIQSGDLRAIEAILFSQATALEAIFAKAALYTACAGTVDTLQTWGSIALKAQNQSRQTLATLIELKNPTKATFIKQQNNAINQQVNNHASHLEKNEESENELLSEKKHEVLDDRGSQQTSTVNTPVATVEAIYGSKNTRGKINK